MSEPTEQKEVLRSLFEEIDAPTLSSILEETMYQYSQLAMHHPDECSLSEVANHIHKLKLIKFTLEKLETKK